jgi:hypothetical protein
MLSLIIQATKNNNLSDSEDKKAVKGDESCSSNKLSVSLSQSSSASEFSSQYDDQLSDSISESENTALSSIIFNSPSSSSQASQFWE